MAPELPFILYKFSHSLCMAPAILPTGPRCLGQGDQGQLLVAVAAQQTRRYVVVVVVVVTWK